MSRKHAPEGGLGDDEAIENSLYDNVYFQHELEIAMKREMNRDKVSMADIHFVGRRHIIIRAMRIPKTQRSHSNIEISSRAELTQEFGKRIMDTFRICGVLLTWQSNEMTSFQKW